MPTACEIWTISSQFYVLQIWYMNMLNGDADSLAGILNVIGLIWNLESITLSDGSIMKLSYLRIVCKWIPEYNTILVLYVHLSIHFLC